MAESGDLLPSEMKEIVCGSCKKPFKPALNAHHTKWCPECRQEQYKNARAENYRGIYRRENLTEKEIYVKKVLDVMEKSIKKHKRINSPRNTKIRECRKAGKTLAEIAIMFNCSRQRIHQICKQSQ